MRAPTAKEMYRRSQLSRSLLQLDPDHPIPSLPNWGSGDDEDSSHTNTDQDSGPEDVAKVLDITDQVVSGALDTVSKVAESVISDGTSLVGGALSWLADGHHHTITLPLTEIPLPISLPTSIPPISPPPVSLSVSLLFNPLPTPPSGSGDGSSSDAPLSSLMPEPTKSDVSPETSTTNPTLTNTLDPSTMPLSTESTNALTSTTATPSSNSSPLDPLSSATFLNSLALYADKNEPGRFHNDTDFDHPGNDYPSGSGSPTIPVPSGSPSNPTPTGPSGAPGNPSSRTISITFSTLLIVLVAGVAGLLWWRKRQNKQGMNMFGRRLELGETPGAWSQIESGEGTGYGAIEKKGKAKEVSRNEADVGYGTIQRGGMLHNTSASAGERRRRKLPVITPILTWVKARSRSKAHKAEGHGANSGTLPRARKARQRQSLSPASLPSSSNTSLRSGSFISSDENDVSIYMHVMQDDDSLTPSPSPRSLSMSMASRLSRISGSTDDLSEFEASPGRGRSRKRRDSQSSSSSEETSDTRSSFGFVRPVVATTGGATPSVFTATGHYITNNASTTTLASPPPQTSTPPETTSNQGSPYGPGLDFFSARAWRKPQTAGPSLMEVVNSWSAPPSPGGVEQGYRSMSGGSSRPS